MQEVPGARYIYLFILFLFLFYFIYFCSDAIAKYRVPGCTRMRHRPVHHYVRPLLLSVGLIISIAGLLVRVVVRVVRLDPQLLRHSRRLDVDRGREPRDGHQPVL